MKEFDEIYSEETIDIKKYIFKILGNWYWFVITSIIALSVAYFVNRYSDRIFQISSSVLILETGGGSYSNEMIQGFDLFKQGTNIVNQKGILKSFDFQKKVLDELDFGVSYFSVGRINDPELYQPAKLKVVLDTNHYQAFNIPVYINILSTEEYEIHIEDKIEEKRIMHFGQPYENDFFSFCIVIRNPEQFHQSEASEFYFYINNPTSLINRYRNRLSLYLQDEEGSILILSTQGYVIQKEVDYLNKLGEVFIRSELERKNQIAVNTIKFIDDQIKAIVDSLSVTEGNLVEFRSENRIIDMSQEGQSLYVQFQSLETRKAQLDMAAKYYDYLLEYLESKKDNHDIIVPTSVGISDQILVSLIMQINSLNSEKISLKFQSVKTNPKLEVIDSKINELKRMLNENVSNLIQTNNLTIQDIDTRIEKLNSEIGKLPFNERQLINIQRRFDLNDQIYTYLLEKRAEAGINQASNIPNARILDKARADQAFLIAPKTRLNYMIAFVIGLLIPFLIIIIRDYFNNKILSKKDIEAKTNATILGVVGHNDKDTDLVVKNNPKSAISESFRTIKTNLQYLVLDKEVKIITITSTISGEGKTFCSLNLASIIAMTDKKTLLVGLDLRRPRMHKHFGLDNSIGLSSYLIGKESIENIILPADIENLFIVASGPVPPNPAKLLETKALIDFLNYARANFDYIVVDTPPIALVSDALLFSKFSDINLFVIRQNYSHKDVLDLINDLNNRPNIPDFNILLNDVKIPAYYGKGYGYGHGYGYGYGYGYGSSNGYYDDIEEKPPLFDKFLRFIKRK